VAGSRGAVGLLVLLDVDVVAVEVRDQDGQGGAIGVAAVAGALDGVGHVQPGVDDREVRLLARRGEFVGPWLAQEHVGVDFLLGDDHSGRDPVEDRQEALLVGAAGHGDLEAAPEVTT